MRHPGRVRRLLLAVAAILVALPVASASARSSLVAVPVSGPLTVPTLERLGLDVTHDVTPRRVIVALHDDADRAALAAAGYASREVVADLEAEHRRAREADRARAAASPRSSLPSGRETYRVLDEYLAELDALAAGHPGLVRRFDLPRRSVEGRPLAAVEIARDVNRDDDGRPVYVVTGLHHPREWPSGEVSMEFARDLAQGYGGDPRISALLDRVRVVVLPVANPDGFVMSRGTVPAAGGGTDPLQRKNAREVDLNRNYGAFWGGNGASVEPASDTYRGPSPWSEPESAAIHEFSQRLHITNFQSIHNIAALVLRPPGFKALGLAPDEARLKELGDRMAAVAGYSSEYGYQLYEVTGATEDWNYVAQNAFGYTIELGGGPTGTFQGPYQTHVVQQYLGADLAPAGGDGVREALLLAGEQAGDERDHAVLEGTAPPGARLRLTRTFETSTSPICTSDARNASGDCATTAPAFTLPDGLDTALRVPASGRFTWHVNPSTRPFVRKAGGAEAWTLSCEVDGRVVRQESLVIGIGERRTASPCGRAAVTPRDLRLSLRGTPRRQRLATVLRRGVRVRARCSRACGLVTRLRRPVRERVLGRRATRRGKAGRISFRARLSRKGRRVVARRRVRRLVVTVRARDTRGTVRRGRVVVRLVGPRRAR